MKTSDQIRRELEATRAELEDVRRDLPTFEQRHAKAKEALSDAIRTGANMKQRETAAGEHARAHHLLEGQLLTIGKLQDEAQRLERDLQAELQAEELHAARERLEAAQERLRKLGSRFTETVEAPLRQIANAYADVIEAEQRHAASKGETYTPRHTPPLLRFITTPSSGGMARDEWWLAVIKHITRLAEDKRRADNAEEREARQRAAQEQAKARQVEGKRRRLERMQARAYGGEREARHLLERELADLDNEAGGGSA